MKDKKISTPDDGKEETGKFKSAEELLAAYNALEREFTKRCQLVSKLQAALASRDGSQAESKDGEVNSEITDNAAPENETADKSTQADGQVNKAAQNAKKAEDAQTEIEAYVKARSTAKETPNAKEYAAIHAEELSEIPEVMDACIEKYKRKIIAAVSVPSPEGMAVIVPAKRPKTLADAKLLADSMFDKF